MYHQTVVAANREAIESRLGVPLREYSPAEVEEFAFRLKDIDWEADATSNIISRLDEDIQRYIWNDLQMCKIDFSYWATRYCHILDDKGHLNTLVPWPSQREFLLRLSKMELESWNAFQDGYVEEMRAQIPLILLKSRQIGGTVISEALLAHLTCFYSNTRSIVASDHPDNTNKLWQVLMRMYELMPGWMRPERDAKVKATNLHLNKLDSDIQAGSGNQKTTLGQGMTVDAAHLTEVSTWVPDNAFSIDADLKPAFNSSRKHHSLFIIESTGAGGTGNWYHDQFQAALKGRSQFKALFIGWFMCPDKWATPSYNVTIRDDIKAVGERIERENGIKVSKDQLAWYQITKDDYESTNKLEMFFQEYPSSIDEAFQTGFRSVFTLETRRALRNTTRKPHAVYEVNVEAKKLRPLPLDEWYRDPNPDKAENRLIIWEPPKQGYVYVIGADVSHGIDGKDYSAVEVLRVGNVWREDEQVAEWWGNIRPVDLVAPIWILGHIYTDPIYQLPAKVAIECNPGSPGISPQTELIRLGYPHFYTWRRPLHIGGGWSNEVGWWTTPGTRHLLVEKGVADIEKRRVKINSLGLIEEMDSFVMSFTPTGMRKVEHAPGEHDDRMMAFLIAYYVAHESDTEAIAEERVRHKELKDRPAEKVKQLNESAASWGLGQSWDKSIEDWEKLVGVDDGQVFY